MPQQDKAGVNSRLLGEAVQVVVDGEHQPKVIKVVGFRS